MRVSLHALRVRVFSPSEKGAVVAALAIDDKHLLYREFEHSLEYSGAHEYLESGGNRVLELQLVS